MAMMCEELLEVMGVWVSLLSLEGSGDEGLFDISLSEYFLSLGCESDLEGGFVDTFLGGEGIGVLVDSGEESVAEGSESLGGSFVLFLFVEGERDLEDDVPFDAAISDDGDIDGFDIEDEVFFDESACFFDAREFEVPEEVESGTSDSEECDNDEQEDEEFFEHGSGMNRLEGWAVRVWKKRGG